MAKPHSPTQYLLVTLPWIIVIFGLLGNTFCAVIVLRKQFRNRNIGVYLLAVAILDTVFLLSNTLLHRGIKVLFEVDVQALSNVGCVFVKFIIYASRAMSAWILVVLTVERMLSLAIPHLAKSINTKRRAIISTAVVVIVQGIIYTYIFKVFTVREEWEVCYWTAEVEETRYNILINISDFLNYSLIPSVAIATSNSVLIYLLKHSQELRSSQGGIDMRSITILVVTTSISFIILTMPLNIFQILYVAGVQTVPAYAYYIMYSLDLLNHAINFILYCVSGASFRKEVKVMCGCACPKLCRPISRGTINISVNPTSSSQPEKAGTSRMRSDSSQPGDVEDQDIQMM